MKTQDIMARLQAKYPGENEYLQAVQEVLESIEEVYNQHPEFEKAKIVERMVEPDRIFTFRVTWVDDRGEVQTNTGYRIQFNSAIGPYKGGLSTGPFPLPCSSSSVSNRPSRTLSLPSLWVARRAVPTLTL